MADGMIVSREPHAGQVAEVLRTSAGSCRCGCMATRPLQTAVEVCAERAVLVQKCADR